jgi:hypothetical protein
MAALLKLCDDHQTRGYKRDVRRAYTEGYSAAWWRTGCATRLHTGGQEQQLAAASRMAASTYAHAHGQERAAAINPKKLASISSQFHLEQSGAARAITAVSGRVRPSRPDLRLIEPYATVLVLIPSSWL